MLICDICTQEVTSEDDMKSHLLLTHMEQDCCCPFCTITGLTYDELSHHINTAHTDTLEPWSSDEEDSGEIQVLTHTSSNLRRSPINLNNHIIQVPNSTSSNVGSPPININNHIIKVPTSATSILGSPPINLNYHIIQVPTSTSSNLKSPPTNINDHIEQTKYKRRLPFKPEQKTNTQHSTVIGCITLENAINEASKSSPLACSAESVHLPLSSANSEVCSTRFNSEGNKENDCQASASAQSIDYSVNTVLECPFCCEIRTSVEELELHVKVEHSDLVDTPTKEASRQQLECPMCALVCGNFQILQEHVNLHLEENLSDEASAGKVSRDLMLARQLQDEEDKKRRAEESQREKEEFKELQRQFGLDNSGGYRQQSVQNLERAVARGRLQPMEFHLHKAQIMESIATGIDDGKTKTSGVLEALHRYYNNAASEVNRVWLCSPLDHFSNAAGDKGWGCGFRNFQMLLSSILRNDSFINCLQDLRYIPCIPKIQVLIEHAWKEGFDPHGASHFSGKLQGTKAWIGACEIYCLLSSLHLKCRILDFHKPSSSSGTHPLLFEWVLNYYSSDACYTTGKVMYSTKPAIYLQHQGHSRTIVGIEERKNKSYCLIIFDPGHSPEIMQRLVKLNIDNSAMKHLRKHLTGLKHKQYQIVAVEGVLTPEEKAPVLHRVTVEDQKAESAMAQEALDAALNSFMFKHKGIYFNSAVTTPEIIDSMENMEIRDSDVFLVTYPKSGTIWTQQVLNLIFNEGQRNGLEVTDNMTRAPWIEYNLYNIDFNRRQSPRLFTTHLNYYLMPKELRFKRAKIIYVLRNPKDVLMSFYHFHKLYTKLHITLEWDMFLDLFLSGRVMCGSWFEHVREWYTHREDYNILFLTYEEMKKDPRSAVMKICNFVDIKLNDQEIDTVVERSAFENMKDDPLANYKFIHKDILDFNKGDFLRKGTVGDWKNRMTVAQNEMFDQVYKEKMKDVPFKFFWDINDEEAS